MLCQSYLFFFTDPATTEIYTLSLHDALPISLGGGNQAVYTLKNNGLKEDILVPEVTQDTMTYSYKLHLPKTLQDRKSTRLNSSHVEISYAVFCLKKKKNTTNKKL